MDNTQGPDEMSAIDRAIMLAEAALDECDEQGLVYAAIDISSALDKLKLIKARAASR